MELRWGVDDADDFAWMVKNSVVPRPIAWVGTVDAEGNGNLAPYSYFNLVTMYPASLMISCTGGRHTFENIVATGEFVVNLVSEDRVAQMVDTAAVVPREVDEARLVGLATTPSSVVRPPRLADAHVALECRLLEHTRVLDADVVFGQVESVWTDDAVLGEDGRIDVARYRPVGRLGGSLYTTVRDSYRIPVPAATPDWIAARTAAEPTG